MQDPHCHTVSVCTVTVLGIEAHCSWNHSLQLVHWTRLPLVVLCLSQGRRHKQYTFNLCSLLVLLLPSNLELLAYGNGRSSPSSRQSAKCFRIAPCSRESWCGPKFSPDQHFRDSTTTCKGRNYCTAIGKGRNYCRSIPRDPPHGKNGCYSG